MYHTCTTEKWSIPLPKKKHQSLGCMDAGVHLIEISHTKVSIYAPHKPQTCHLVIWQGATSKAPESRVSSIQELETPETLERKYSQLGRNIQRIDSGPNEFIRNPHGPSPSQERIEVRFWPLDLWPHKYWSYRDSFLLFPYTYHPLKIGVGIESLVGCPKTLIQRKRKRLKQNSKRPKRIQTSSNRPFDSLFQRLMVIGKDPASERFLHCMAFSRRSFDIRTLPPWENKKSMIFLQGLT